jgi:integrase/recombinase XerD
VIGGLLVWVVDLDQEEIMSTGDAFSTTAGTPVAVVLEDYRAFLVGERGLAAGSVRGYLGHARVFLEQLPDPLDAALAGLSAGQITTFMIGYCQGRNTWSAKAMVTALRSLLRFLHVAGAVPMPLAGAVPSVAGWRLASLPRGLDAGQVDAVVGSCNKDTIVGRRDYAILIVLARLGLRTAEVAALRLGDVDWRSGQLLIRGKGNRIERLPLPVMVGQALTGYLTGGRPRCACRSLFITARAPRIGLSAMAVRQVVARACARAGLPRLGAHRLRHTLASDMLRAGASLAQVGQVLRHRSELSTAIYAKVDHDALRELARPWPGGAA